MNTTLPPPHVKKIIIQNSKILLNFFHNYFSFKDIFTFLYSFLKKSKNNQDENSKK